MGLAELLLIVSPIMGDTVPPPPPPPPRKEEIFRDGWERMPVFPGEGCDTLANYSERKKYGEIAMLEYIYGHLQYPDSAKVAGVEGWAVISFTVEKDGSMTDIRVVRNPGTGTGAEAERIIRKMVEDGIRWEPGTQADKPVRVQFNLPVKFKLD